MLKLSRQQHVLFIISTLCTAVLIAVPVLQPTAWGLYTGAVFLLLLISILLLGKVSRAIKAAQLIIENQILHTEPVIFKKQSQKKSVQYLPGNSIEVFISCFGILLGAKIIIFNQSEVRLRTVELGRYYITLTYGTDRKIRKAKVLHSEIRNEQLIDIIRKFQYETGITPTVTL